MEDVKRHSVKRWTSHINDCIWFAFVFIVLKVWDRISELYTQRELTWKFLGSVLTTVALGLFILVLLFFVAQFVIVVAKRAMSDGPENHQESQEQNENAMRTNDGKFHRTILNQCLKKLLQDLDFRAVYPCIVTKDLFDEPTFRDISEQKTSTEKIQYLIDRLKERDEVTYAKFKECLVLSKQDHLKNLLEQKENEVVLEME